MLIQVQKKDVVFKGCTIFWHQKKNIMLIKLLINSLRVIISLGDHTHRLVCLEMKILWDDGEYWWNIKNNHFYRMDISANSQF